MQPADDYESVAAAIHLSETGVCLFDLSLGGARLKLVVFGSHGCNDNEKIIHLQEKVHAADGPSLRTGNTCGGVTFTGYVIALPLKKYWNMMVVFR